MQSEEAFADFAKWLVSIPNRDFDELQYVFIFLWNTMIDAFQSLIGILMNCNIGKYQMMGLFTPVSIPNRDFDELQLQVNVLALREVCFNP